MPSARLPMLVAAAVLVGVGIAYAMQGDTAPRPAAPMPAPRAVVQLAEASPAQDNRQVPQSRTEMELSFAPLVKQVAPAVVNVYATTITREANSPFADDPFFSQLFGRGGPLFQSRPRAS